MPYQLIKKLDSDNWVKLSGTLKVRDFQELQSLARLSLEQFGRLRMLVELEDFQVLKNLKGLNPENNEKSCRAVLCASSDTGRHAVVDNQY